MPVYAAVTRYGSHRPKHRRNIASRVPLIDPPPGSRCIPMRTVCYSVQRRRNSTHTREEARSAARERESVTDACRARCAESRGRGTRSFTFCWIHDRLLVVVWTLESAWRRDREVITRQTGRSSGPAPARCGRRPWQASLAGRCRSDMRSDAGRVAAAASDRARRAQRAPRQRESRRRRPAQGREAVPVAPR